MVALRLLAAAVLATAIHAQTNLPTVPPGVFEASARILVNAPIHDVWNAILDFPCYPDWNPFVRQVFGDVLFVMTPAHNEHAATP